MQPAQNSTKILRISAKKGTGPHLITDVMHDVRVAKQRQQDAILAVTIYFSEGKFVDKRDQSDLTPGNQPDSQPETSSTDTESQAPEPDLTPDTPETSTTPDDSEAAGAEHSPTDADSNPTVSVEAEPATGTGIPPGQEPTPVSEQLAADDSTTSPVASPQRDMKRTIILAIIAVAVIVSAAIVFWLALKPADTEERQGSVAAPVEQPKLGVAISVADGTVEFSLDDGAWQPLTNESQLSEGTTVRTGEGSRTVLALDDGSAVRLDALSSIKLASLAADNIRIDHLSGSVYSRVVPSERTYTVNVDDTSYQALGTAFVTIKTESENGVQVMQSSVKASGTESTIGEGKQYYKTSGNPGLEGKVTDIDLGSLAGNEFITWNLSEDEKDAKFKDKLGVLANIKQLVADQEAAHAASEAERKKLEAEQAKKAAEDSKKDKSEHDHHKSKVTRGQMSLSAQADTLNWSYTGQAPHGYKLVYAEHDNPTFGSDETKYFSDPNTLSAQVSKYFKKHKTYKVRVCAYTAGTETDKCVDYSNVVQVARTT